MSEEKKHNCENCLMRKKAEKTPKLSPPVCGSGIPAGAQAGKPIRHL